MSTPAIFVETFVHKYFNAVWNDDKEAFADFYGNAAVFSSADEDAPVDAASALTFLSKYNRIFEIHAYHVHQSENVSLIVLDGSYGAPAVPVSHTIALQKHENGYAIVADSLRENETAAAAPAYAAPTTELWTGDLNQPVAETNEPAVNVAPTEPVAVAAAGTASPTRAAAARKTDREPRERRNNTAKDAAAAGAERPKRAVHHVYVGGLAANTSEADVRSLFPGVGINHVQVGQSNAFVSLKGGASAAAKVVDAASKTLNGRTVKVEVKNPRK